VAYREENGGFKNVDELTAVSGIGEKTLEKIRHQVCVN
jgi:DNA uptake protein and related DNA-binding proteins